MSTIPASQLVSVTPSVLAAGGNALVMNGLMLTESTRPPVGGVLSFPDAASVGAYFGLGSNEYAEALVYCGGFDNSNIKPGSVLVAQYPNVAVAAYLRGGPSGLTLGGVQALTGSLTAVVDGYTHVISSVSLAAATSFSSAASIIGAAFTDPTESSFTASIGSSSTTCTSTGTTLTLGALASGYLSPGDLVTGTDSTNSLPAGCYIVKQLTGTPGGSAGATFQLSAAATPGNLTSCTVTGTSKVLDVTVCASPTIAVGQTVTGATVAAGTLVTSQISGTAGGVGLYAISGAAQGVASESMTGVATAPVVTYDSVSGAFVITSGVTGVASTAAFATGTLAAPLFLTSATGAVLSQGAAAATPSAFMSALLLVNQNWATFMTLFDPDGGSGNVQKLAFATWNSQQNNRYAYICWDTDASPTATVPATSSLGYLLAQSNISGTCLVYEPSNLHLAAFVCGSAASIDFNEKNGRITFAFKGQSGLTPSVTDATTAANLIANGYNFYGVYATANQQFINFQNGSVSGEFKWLDTYLDQVYFNAQFQLALMVLMTSIKSLPYAPPGYAQVMSACADVISQGLNFGAFVPGVPLSASQAAQVNAAAGLSIAPTITAQGWYLQVLAATPQVRQARGSPPATFWYADGGSIQKINLASVTIL